MTVGLLPAGALRPAAWRCKVARGGAARDVIRGITGAEVGWPRAISGDVRGGGTGGLAAGAGAPAKGAAGIGRGAGAPAKGAAGIGRGAGAPAWGAADIGWGGGVVAGGGVTGGPAPTRLDRCTAICSGPGVAGVPGEPSCCRLAVAGAVPGLGAVGGLRPGSASVSGPGVAGRGSLPAGAEPAMVAGAGEGRSWYGGAGRAFAAPGMLRPGSEALRVTLCTLRPQAGIVGGRTEPASVDVTPELAVAARCTPTWEVAGPSPGCHLVVRSVPASGRGPLLGGLVSLWAVATVGSDPGGAAGEDTRGADRSGAEAGEPGAVGAG
ncbi:MAG: hypothetical protein ACRDY2_12010 [Acidimicrobiales bacterium]